MKVYKIGGSSLDSDYKLFKILDILNNDELKIVIVSAIGRYPSPYSTDTFFTNTSFVCKKEQDLLVSCGEIISSVFLSNFLNQNNVKSIALSPYSFDVKNIDKLLIQSYFNNYNTIIIPGFVYTIDNEIFTMNRGGSNITAALFAEVFSKELIIITDVCGIYDKNPSVDNATYIKSLSYDEFLLLNKTDIFFPKEAISILKKNNIITSFIKYDDFSKCSRITP